MENDLANSVDGKSATGKGHEPATQSARSPWGYYWIMGTAFALLGVAFALSGSIIRTLAVIAFLVLGNFLQRGYRRPTDTWIGGFQSGMASWWTIGFLVVSLGTVVAGWRISENIGQAWPAWIMGTLILGETLLYGYFFYRATHGLGKESP